MRFILWVSSTFCRSLDLCTSKLTYEIKKYIKWYQNVDACVSIRMYICLHVDRQTYRLECLHMHTCRQHVQLTYTHQYTHTYIFKSLRYSCANEHLWMNHVTHVNKSCHTHTNESCNARTNESCRTFPGVMHLLCVVCESCIIRTCVTSLIRVCGMTYSRVSHE